MLQKQKSVRLVDESEPRMFLSSQPIPTMHAGTEYSVAQAGIIISLFW